MRVVAYVRVSTDEQNEEGQLTEIRRWAEANGAEIVKTFVDKGVSGTVDPLKRPGFRAALDFSRENDVAAIVMYDMTRFSRAAQPAEVLHLLRKIIDEYGVAVIFVKEPVIEDPLFRELWLFLKSWYSAYERIQIAARARYGIERLRLAGRLYHRPRLVHYYAAYLTGKKLGEVTVEDVEAAKKQLCAIISALWDGSGIKHTRLAEYLRSHDLAGLVTRFPKAPLSYWSLYKLGLECGYVKRRKRRKRGRRRK